MKKFPEEEYSVPFFKEAGYVRKLCPRCGEYFWTQNPDQETCGEARLEGCAFYTFINNPPTRKSYSLREMREAFLSFFEKRGHTRIKHYPVVARWRDDIYLTNASIIDFQPYVTEGIAPPPANPLVIVQPCIRMVDIANTGPTFGKYLTIFEMGGHHAFNYPDKEVYWKDQTVRYHHEFVTKDLGAKSEEVIYKEEVWSGGGNAGPCVECIIRGLEVATLVFMQYKVVNNEFVKLPIRTVDTGYGIDRYAWLSQGVPSGFHVVYDNLLDKIFEMTEIGEIDNDLLMKVAEVSGLVSLDKTASRLEARKRTAEMVGMNVDDLDNFLLPIENVFAVADHTKCLGFILSEGVVPSNIQEGYLARLLFRRIYRLLKMLGIADKLYDIMNMQIDFWSKDYPHLKEMRNEIMEILSVEKEKFQETIKRGEGLVKRIAGELKTNNIQEIPVETLTELYDSHGLPPEIVKQFAEEERLKAEIPENFYALIAQRHIQAPRKVEEAKPEELLEIAVSNLPETEQLYYQDQYIREFEAKVVKVLDNEYVVLDKTCFYPEGGGQPADTGYLVSDGNKVDVADVQKVGKVIVHKMKRTVPKEGSIVKGVIDWERRYSLMKNHTATHVVNGAARRVLGQHVWQFGTQKGVERSRLDISHYRRLTLQEIHKIETLANQVVLRNIPVETSWKPRSEAEKLYGFRLYQGGAVPGKEIRVVKSGEWDVEACAGTHVKNTGEIGFIKIIHSERVQDGVERLDYSVGIPALKAMQQNEQKLWKLSEILNAPLEKLDKTAEKVVKELKEANAEKRKLIKEIAERESAVSGGRPEGEEIKELEGIKITVRDFKEAIDVDRMVRTANVMIKRDGSIVTIFYGTDGENARIMVMAGKTALEKGVNAGEIVKEASAIIGGGGGGKPDFAQGGGTQTEKLPEAVKKAEEVLEKQLRP
ncbi:MAG: alanine--tRNA ligase [Candidatus Bathyarchaeota archaeon]|nr:alanine--tRNA ligase [Candidatus Bathyarchaeota archaeon]MDH5745928.1 alanine--tRNA ligase [Candidatus Bathyarchaeota archaeon]